MHIVQLKPPEALFVTFTANDLEDAIHAFYLWSTEIQIIGWTRYSLTILHLDKDYILAGDCYVRP